MAKSDPDVSLFLSDVRRAIRRVNKTRDDAKVLAAGLIDDDGKAWSQRGRNHLELLAEATVPSTRREAAVHAATCAYFAGRSA